MTMTIKTLIYREHLALVSFFIAAMIVAVSPQYAWSDANGQTALDIAWGERVEVASGNAHRGPWRMNNSEYDFVDDGTVAINDQGYIAVAWADHVKQDIFIQLFSPDNQPLLDQPVNVSRSEGIFSWLPRVLISNGDQPDNIEISMIWQDIVFRGGGHGGEIFFARSSDGGKTFTTPYNLSDTIAGSGKGRTDPQRWHNGSYDMTICSQGHIYAAWTEYEGNLWFSRSTDGGRTFSSLLHLAGGDDALPARGPTLAADGQGRVYLAWTVGDIASSDIHFAMSADGGESFSEPHVVHQSDGHADAPRLVVDSDRTVHLVYAESPDGPYERYHLHYTRLRDGQSAFDEPRVIVDPQVIGLASVHFPALKLDGDDHLYLLWERFANHRGRPVGLGFSRSADGGRTFTVPVVVPHIGQRLGFNGSQQGLLMNKLAVNRTGQLAVVNSTFNRDESSHIWLIRAKVVANP